MTKPAKLKLAALLLALLALEGASFFGTKLLSRYSLFYEPADPAGYAQYLRERDPVLGWSRTTTASTEEIDASGSRIVPAFPDPSLPACVSSFGDSFTFGAEVPAEDSYPNLLARELGCRVNNFGVGGYGTDQAFLRYRHLAADSPRFVVLGHYAEDIVRNVNQLRDLNAGGSFFLKPRFVLEGGQLRLVPLPNLDADDFARITTDAQRLLPHEFFRPGGAAGIVVRRFPFTLSLARVSGQYRVRAVLRGVPSYAAFYQADHPSGALAVTIAILDAFVREARAHGQSPVVLLIPDIADLEARRAGHPVHYAPLTSALAARGIEALDAAPELDRVAGARGPCAVYTACGRGHLSAEGNAVLAHLVAQRVRTVAPTAVTISGTARGSRP
ncbi:MAG TPA: hypothetical protein VFO62_05530 [Candidatus Binatia bacterium]|nr:hypothetical protein [Candidatus Binatia bacterium]